ncbi:MAG TPA: hypothetical protein VFO55_07090 [Gemmatimonadaceae bacterium]|nr:hypothetical protein [Gemmatimonadaceae bacterium]
MRGAATVGAILLAGCGFVSVHPRVGNKRPATPGIPPGAGPDVVDARGPGTDSRRVGANTRVICRTSGMPRGYALIDYTTATSCMQSADSSSHNAMVIQDISQMPHGTVLTVCRDQAVPRGWYRTWNDEDSGQCIEPNRKPGAARTTMEIRKGG